MPGFQFVLRLKSGRFTRFDHQFRQESKTLQEYSFQENFRTAPYYRKTNLFSQW